MWYFVVVELQSAAEPEVQLVFWLLLQPVAGLAIQPVFELRLVVEPEVQLVFWLLLQPAAELAIQLVFELLPELLAELLI